jgi:hypothetical protein
LELHVVVGQLLDLLLQLESLPLNDLLLELIGLVPLGDLVEEQFEDRVDQARRLHQEFLGDGEDLVLGDL